MQICKNVSIVTHEVVIPSYKQEELIPSYKVFLCSYPAWQHSYKRVQHLNFYNFSYVFNDLNLVFHKRLQLNQPQSFFPLFQDFISVKEQFYWVSVLKEQQPFWKVFFLQNQPYFLYPQYCAQIKGNVTELLAWVYPTAAHTHTSHTMITLTHVCNTLNFVLEGVTSIYYHSIYIDYISLFFFLFFLLHM